jgi:hypothetical protein
MAPHINATKINSHGIAITPIASAKGNQTTPITIELIPGIAHRMRLRTRATARKSQKEFAAHRYIRRRLARASIHGVKLNSFT